MRVLLVEDSKSMRDVIHAMLESLGADVVDVSHGGEAWERLQSDPFDLVLTDWNMPVLDGIELLKKIRADASQRSLPVIVSTIRSERNDVVVAVRAGADAFLTKPYRQAQLKAKIEHALAHRPEHRVDRVLAGVDRLERDNSEPLVLIGEAAITGQRLRREDNEGLLDFLVTVSDALHAINSRSDVHIGYTLGDNSLDITKCMRVHAQRVKMVLLDTAIGPSSVSLARLLALNKPEDRTILLVADNIHEVPASVRDRIERLGVSILERRRLTGEAVETLLLESIVAHHGVAAAAEPPSPEEIARRMEGDLRNMVHLPVLPRVYQQISELDADPDSEMEAWVEAVESDPLTQTLVVRRARSPLFGFRGEINDANKAVVLLGKRAVKEIVVSGAMQRSLERVQEAGFSVEDYWAHSVATGLAAKILSFPLDAKVWTPEMKRDFERLRLDDEAVECLRGHALHTRYALPPEQDPFVAGVMHDIGKVALAHGYPGLFELVLAQLREIDWAEPMRTAEKPLTGGADHTVAGGILAEAWQLDVAVRSVIRDHHGAASAGDLADLVAAADFVAGGIYPFPRDAAGPQVGLFASDAPAVDDVVRLSLEPFLPEARLLERNLGFESLVEVGRVIEPCIRRQVEELRASG